MNISKVIFTYAYPLDQNRRKLFQDNNWPHYPTSEEVMKKVEEYKGIWEEVNATNRIIKRIIELLGVDYPRDIEAFVLGSGMQPMSTPLLIPVMRKEIPYSKEEFITLMIHELTHIFAAGTKAHEGIRNYWNMVREKYISESVLVQNHLIVYAVLQTIVEELFGKELAERLIQAKDPDYIRSIELTNQLGREHIINEFRELTKS